MIEKNQCACVTEGAVLVTIMGVSKSHMYTRGRCQPGTQEVVLSLPLKPILINLDGIVVRAAKLLIANYGSSKLQEKTPSPPPSMKNILNKGPFKPSRKITPICHS